MFKTYFFIFAMGAISINTFAQQDNAWQWISRGGSPASIPGYDQYDEEGVHDMATDSDQNTYILSTLGNGTVDINGTTFTNEIDGDNSQRDKVLVSFDCNGNYRWSKIFGGFGQEEGYFLKVGPNDQIYIAGQFGTCDPNGPAHIGQDTTIEQSFSECSILFMANFSQDGDLNWLEMPQQALESGLTGPGGSLSQDLLMDDEGNLYWLAFFTPTSLKYSGPTISEEGMYILKYNPQGDFQEVLDPNIELDPQWFGNLRFYRNPYNGHFYFTSRSLDPDDIAVVDGTTIDNAFFLAHYDAQMNLQWITEDNTDEDPPGVFDIKFDDNNNIYIGGQLPLEGDFLGVDNPENTAPTFMMKVDASEPSVQWSTSNNQLTNDTGDIDLKNDTIILVSTGYNINLAEGCECYEWGDQTMTIPELDGEVDITDPIIAYFDKQSGEVLHLDYLKCKNGSDVYTMTLDAAGDVLMGGSFDDMLYDGQDSPVYANNGVQTDFFVAKYATAPCNEPLSTAPVAQQQNWQVYPNPTKNRLNLELDREVGFKLYDLQGRLVRTGKLNPGNPSLELNGFQDGVYFLRISNNNGRTETLKVVKE